MPGESLKTYALQPKDDDDDDIDDHDNNDDNEAADDDNDDEMELKLILRDFCVLFFLSS